VKKLKNVLKLLHGVILVQNVQYIDHLTDTVTTLQLSL